MRPLNSIIHCIFFVISTYEMELLESNGVQIKSKLPKSNAEALQAEIKENFRWRNVNISEDKMSHHSPIVKRSVPYPGSDLEFGGPLCYERYVTGNCRYRTDPEYCYQYEWTAYALIRNLGGGVRSDPPGLLVEPGIQEPLKVWLRVSCCFRDVRIFTVDPYNQELITCIVDVRELQGLHPAEIAGIVIGVLVFLFILITSTFLMVRKTKRANVAAHPRPMIRNRRTKGSTRT